MNAFENDFLLFLSQEVAVRRATVQYSC